MDARDRLDPELRHLAELRTDLSRERLAVTRAGLDRRRRETAAALDSAGVQIVEHQVVLDDRTVAVRVYHGGTEPSPAVIYCHAGAFVLGNLDTDHLQCVEWARNAPCTVISVDYRLAPEHPCPAALDDVLAVLDWAVTEADELRIDPARLGIAGSSAGGALAASVAQRSARGEAPPLAFQLLHQPVLDNRPSPSKEEFVDTPGFDGPAVAQMWRYYLDGDLGSVDAVPGACEQLSGLPAALITCSELDPLRDEAIDYALRLMWSGVATELHVFPGSCHGFDSMAPDSAMSRQLFALQSAALRRAL